MSIEARLTVNRDDFLLDVDILIPETGITALFGPSGCGKTTLLRAIAGLEQSPDGYIKVGNNIWQDAQQNIAPHQRALGYVFQEASLFPHLNVLENLQYGFKRTAATQRKIPLDRIIDWLGIGHLLERRSQQLSGGERQRVAIGRALAVSPQLLLMDEPLAALDQASKQEILPYLEILREELEIPLLYVSHSIDEVARLADHLVLMKKGAIEANGKITELLTRLDLPLAHGESAEAIIEATVAGHDEDYELTHVDFSGGRFNVAHKDLSVGHSVRLRIAARDVSLTLAHQTDTSILNIFPVTVDEIKAENSAQLMVRLLAGDVPLLSRVTRKSATLLNLQTGKELYAQVKSVALLK